MRDINEPWWMRMPVEAQVYRTWKGHITKAMKISAAMSKITAINESMRPEKKFNRGVVVLKGMVK